MTGFGDGGPRVLISPDGTQVAVRWSEAAYAWLGWQVVGANTHGWQDDSYVTGWLSLVVSAGNPFGVPTEVPRPGPADPGGAAPVDVADPEEGHPT